jgi:hypothetical protein
LPGFSWKKIYKFRPGELQPNKNTAPPAITEFPEDILVAGENPLVKDPKGDLIGMGLGGVHIQDFHPV